MFFDKFKLINDLNPYRYYIYCGKYSNFNLYPNFHRFCIEISLKSQNVFIWNATFSVSDKSLIFTPLYLAQMVIPSESHLKFHHQSYHIKDNYYVASFLIKLKKLHKVELHIINKEESNYVIFDGPGYIFSVINKNGEKPPFATSSFQCLLQFLTTYLMTSNKNHFFCIYCQSFEEKLHENYTRFTKFTCDAI